MTLRATAWVMVDLEEALVANRFELESGTVEDHPPSVIISIL